MASVLTQRIVPAADTPVIQQRPLLERVAPDHLIDGDIRPQLAPLLSLRADPPQQPEIVAVVIHEMLFAAGGQLGGEQTCQKLQGDRVLDHEKQLVIEINELVKAVHFRWDGLRERLVLLVK